MKPCRRRPTFDSSPKCIINLTLNSLYCQIAFIIIISTAHWQSIDNTECIHAPGLNRIPASMRRNVIGMLQSTSFPFSFEYNLLLQCYDFKCQIWSETEFVVAFNRSTATRHSLSVSDLTYSLTSLEFQMFLVVESIKLCLEIQFHSFFFQTPRHSKGIEFLLFLANLNLS